MLTFAKPKAVKKPTLFHRVAQSSEFYMGGVKYLRVPGHRGMTEDGVLTARLPDITKVDVFK